MQVGVIGLGNIGGHVAAIADFEVQLKNAQILLRRAEQLQKAGVRLAHLLETALHR